MTFLSLHLQTPQRVVTIMEFLFGRMVVAVGTEYQDKQEYRISCQCRCESGHWIIKFNSTSVEKHQYYNLCWISSAGDYAPLLLQVLLLTTSHRIHFFLTQHLAIKPIVQSICHHSTCTSRNKGLKHLF